MTILDLIKAALREDMPNGDVTTESLAMSPKLGRARLIAKQDLILSGCPVFETTVHLMDPNSKLKWHFDESHKVLKNQIVCTIQGDLIQLLKAERVALNFIMHLSGIATLTRKFVDQVQPYSTKILDTRKTTPGYRDLEKKAVVHGGGFNHRLNLSTGILVKDNHIALMKGVRTAVERIRQHSDLPIEVEARTLEEVKTCVELGVYRILLDNMDNEALKAAKSLIPPSVQTEASGNMNLDRVHDVAALGIDFISVGALTHSAPSADLSLKFDWEGT